MKAIRILLQVLFVIIINSNCTPKVSDSLAGQANHEQHSYEKRKGEYGCIPNKWINFESTETPTFKTITRNNNKYVVFDGATIHEFDQDSQVHIYDVGKIFFKTNDETLRLWNEAILNADKGSIEIGICDPYKTEPMTIGERKYFDVGAVFVNDIQVEPISPSCKNRKGY